ncbi:hypothetical protein D3C72_1623260 [compost metagenome]
MQQHAATLKVFQEANTQTRTFSGTRDQTRNVSNHETLFVIHTDNAQAWHQGRERIIRHFRFSRRNRTNEGRFTGVWHAQHTHIRQQHQFKLQVALITRCTHRFLTRSTVNGRFETAVTQTVPTPFRHHQTLTVFGHVTQGFACTLIDNARTDRYFDRHVFTAFTSTVTTLTILTTLGAERFFKTVVDQRVEVFIRL